MLSSSKYIFYTLEIFIDTSHSTEREKKNIVQAMFVSRNSLSGKPLSKLSCVCLPLGKLVNEKHFPVNRNTFRSDGKHFPVRKIWFSFQENVFPFGCVCFPENSFRETTFQTFLCLFAIRKVGQRKTLSSQRKIQLGFQESVFLENLGGKHFPEVVKNLEMSLFADCIKFDPQTFDCYI